MSTKSIPELLRKDPPPVSSGKGTRSFAIDWSWTLASIKNKGWHQVVGATFKHQGSISNWKRNHPDLGIDVQVAVRGTSLYVKVTG